MMRRRPAFASARKAAYRFDSRRRRLAMECLESRRMLADLSQFDSGLKSALDKLEDKVFAEVFGSSMPLVGLALKTADQAVGGDAQALQQIQNLLTGGAITDIASLTGYLQNKLGVIGAPNSILQQFQTFDSDADPSITFHTKLAKNIQFHLPFNTGLSALGLSVVGDVQVALGFVIDTRFGVDGSGFFVDTANGGVPELTVTLDVTIASFTGQGDFGLLKVTAEDNPADHSRFTGAFAVDLVDATNKFYPATDPLGALDLQSKFSATASKLSLNLEAEFGGGSVNPKLSANLEVVWPFSDANPEGAFANFGGAPAVALKNVSIDVGSLFGSFLTPILEKFAGAAEPFAEIVDGLNQPVFPGQDFVKLTYLDVIKLSSATTDGTDLGTIGGGGVTSALTSFGVGAGKNEDFSFLDLVVKVAGLYHASKDFAATGKINLGTYTLSDPRSASPGNVFGLVASKLPIAGAFNGLKVLADDFFALADQFQTAKPEAGGGGAFHLDIMEDTDNVFKLLLGDPSAKVLTFNLPELSESFYKAHYINMLLYVVPVSVTFKAGLGFEANLGGGYDGAGLAKFRSSHDVVDILDGFFLNSTDPFLKFRGRGPLAGDDRALIVEATAGIGWEDATSLQLTGDLGEALAFDFGIAVEVSGKALDIVGQLNGRTTDTGAQGVDFAFVDPNADGKLRFSEMAHQANEGLECLFDVSGGVDWSISAKTELSAEVQIQVEVEVELGPFEVGVDIEIELDTRPVNHTWAEDHGELFSLDFECADDGVDPAALENPLLARLEPDGRLVLFVGDEAVNRNISPDVIDETYQVRHTGGAAGNESVSVHFQGATQSFAGVTSIVASAGSGQDVIELAADVLSSASLFGGAGDDRLQVGQGAGFLYGDGDRDLLYGGPAADSLSGGEGDDDLFGGGGADSLFGGPGKDLLNGDDDDDAMTGDLGDDRFFGGGGADTVVETADVDFALTDISLAGLGADTLSSVERAILTGAETGGANTFRVSSWTGTASLDARGGDDVYQVTFHTSVQGKVAITDFAGASDELKVFGTSVADTLEAVTGKISRGAQEVTYQGVESAAVSGQEGDDQLKIRSTSLVPLTVNGDAGLDRIEVGLGNLAAIQAAVIVDGGTNLDALVASDELDATPNVGQLFVTSPVVGLEVGNLTGLGMGASGIVYSPKTENIDVRLGAGSDDFLTAAVPRVRLVGATGTTILAGAGDDVISVGSRATTDQGDLDRIKTRLIVRGGADGGAGAPESRDRIYVNDRTDLSPYHYKLTPASLIDDPDPESPVSRTFAGLTYDGTTEFFRLDGTDAPNVFDVGPSPDTKYFLDGNLPAPGSVAPDRGDFLKLDTKTIPTLDRLLDITSRGSGSWTFPVTLLKDVQFESIEKFNHVDIVAVGADVASKGASRPSVDVYDAENHRFKFRIPASATYGVNNKYGVRLAVADVDGDGLPDVITAPGRNTKPDVKVFLGTPQAGLQGTLYATLSAAQTFGNSFKDGVAVAAGDVDGDAMPEVIVAPDRGAATVKIYHNQVLEPGATTPLKTVPRNLNAFSDIKKYAGGATLAVGNLDGDRWQVLELIVGTGAGVVGKVRTFSLAGPTPVTLRTITDPANFNKGLFVAAGDVDGDGIAEIVTGAGSGGASRVRTYRAADGVQVSTFLAFSAPDSPNAPLRITMRDANDDGRIDLFVMQGQDGRSGYKLKKFEPLTGTLVDAVFATIFNPDFAGGGVNLG